MKVRRVRKCKEKNIKGKEKNIQMAIIQICKRNEFKIV